jgi:hypothetical protein
MGKKDIAIHVVVPVDADVERARLALSDACDRYGDNDCVSDALYDALRALARVNTAIASSEAPESDPARLHADGFK